MRGIVSYLGKNPIIISDIAFVGTIGWYDYSTRNESLDSVFPMAAYESKRSFFGIWNDGEWAYWPRDPKIESKDCRPRKLAHKMSDQDVAKMLCQDLSDQLRTIEGKVKKAVALTHTVPFKELVKYTGHPSSDFACAFIGSVQLGETIRASKSVTHAICGRTHFPAVMKLHSVECICSPIGYLDNFEGDLYEYVADRVKTFIL